MLNKVKYTRESDLLTFSKNIHNRHSCNKNIEIQQNLTETRNYSKQANTHRNIFH